MKNLISSRRRKMLATFAAVCASALAGLVFAAWLTDSEGPGAAKGGQIQQPTVAASPTPEGTVFPGGTGAAAFQITNPNASPLKVTAISPALLDGGTTDNSACPFSNLSVNSQAGLNIPVPTGSTRVVVPDGFALAADAPNDCQNALLNRRARLTFSTQ